MREGVGETLPSSCCRHRCSYRKVSAVIGEKRTTERCDEKEITARKTIAPDTLLGCKNFHLTMFRTDRTGGRVVEEDGKGDVRSPLL